MKKLKKNKRESGQAIVEFALVLPIFLLLIMGIIDFGFLFYNYIGIENSARNAARIACVEYTDCCYDKENKSPKRNATFMLGDFYSTGDGKITDEEDVFTEQEEDIAKAIYQTLPRGVLNNLNTVKFKIVYSYDEDDSMEAMDFDVNKRYTGDVTVSVQGDANVLTPVLGVTAHNMKRTLSSVSTFKVEKQYAENTG